MYVITYINSLVLYMSYKSPIASLSPDLKLSQDFKDFLELRDPLLGSRLARSPRQSRAEEDEKSVALPLLSLDLETKGI